MSAVKQQSDRFFSHRQAAFGQLSTAAHRSVPTVGGASSTGAQCNRSTACRLPWTRWRIQKGNRRRPGCAVRWKVTRRLGRRVRLCIPRPTPRRRPVAGLVGSAGWCGACRRGCGWGARSKKSNAVCRIFDWTLAQKILGLALSRRVDLPFSSVDRVSRPCPCLIAPPPPHKNQPTSARQRQQ